MLWDTVQMQEALLIMLYTVFGAIVLTCTIYAGARAAALGWYRTKYEHFKRIWNVTRED